MPVLRLLLVLALPAFLAGCFTSKEPLIGADKAVFPYDEIVYAEAPKGEPSTLTKTGDAYVMKGKDTDAEAFFRFAPAGDGFYVAQMEFTEDAETRRLYSLLKVDFDKKTVLSYVSVAPDEGVDAPGLAACGDDTICIESLDAYVAYGRAAIEAGRKPDSTYDIISLK